MSMNEAVCTANARANYGTLNSVDICHSPENVTSKNSEPEWNCAKSSYQDTQLWTRKNDTLYRHENGLPVKEVVKSCCNYNPIWTVQRETG